MTSHPFVELRQVFSGVRVAQFSFLCSVLQIIVCPLSFFFWPLFLDLRIMIIHFVSSNSSIKHWNSLDFQKVEIRIQTIPTLFQITRNLGCFFFAFSAYRQRKMVLTSRFWFKVEYCFTIVFYENVDIKFSAHNVFLE